MAGGAVQLTLEGALKSKRAQKKRKRSKFAAGLCAVCARFHRECVKQYVTMADGKRSRKKRPVCPNCQSDPRRRVVGKNLASISPTALATFGESCPEKALRQGGPRKFRNQTPTSFDNFVGLMVHRGLSLWTTTAYRSFENLLGGYGLGGFWGTALNRPKQAGLPRGLTHDAKAEAEPAFDRAVRIIRYAVRSQLVKNTKTGWLLDPSIIFAQTEVPFRVTLETLLEHNGRGKPPLNCVLRGQVDFIRVHQSPKGLRVVITDYKSFLPAEEELENYRRSLQLRVYGLWAAWAFEVPLENITLQLIFIEEQAHRIAEVSFSEDDPRETLQMIYDLLVAYTRIADASSTDLAKRTRQLFPPREGPHCTYCPYQSGLCSLRKPPPPCGECQAEMVWIQEQWQCPFCMYKD